MNGVSLSDNPHESKNIKIKIANCANMGYHFLKWMLKEE